MKTIIHLLPNAHLDPVWLWDWREGLNEGITTVRTILNLMDEFPDLTFIRGESAIYRHIQKNEPATFRRMLKRIAEGRWDVVGGTLIQPDTNLISTEVLCREYEIGLEYCEKELGVRPRIAWQADSFGHAAGLPSIFAAFGIEGFCFTRPQSNAFKMDAAAFWWKGANGNRTLCYRPHWSWYGTERDRVHDGLNETLSAAQKNKLTHVGLPLGLGNHGGGPTRRHLLDIEVWKKEHPDVEVRYSTFHRFFDTIRREIAKKPNAAPTIEGEFGFCLRGCYSSVQKFKSLYRKGEIAVTEAEITQSAIAAATGSTPRDLSEAWDTLAFNAFHDILPGSSIERAYDEQSAWMGLAIHRAEQAKAEALNELTARIDTSVPAPRSPDVATDVPFVIWNPLPREFKGLVEIEACLDYRPIWSYVHRASEVPLVAYGADGKAIPFQEILTETTAMPQLPWRKRLLVPVTIPALGWTSATIGWREEKTSEAPKTRCAALDANAGITNGDWTVRVAKNELVIEKGGKNFFASSRHLGLVVVEDPWGSWGGMGEEKDAIHLENVREKWALEKWEILERGPLRAKMWARWKGKNSWITLTFAVEDGSPVVAVEARLLWNERSSRLKLVLPSTGPVRYDVAGSTVVRDETGQVPGGRWAVRSGIGFASDVLADFDAVADELRVTIARASRYANDSCTSAEEKPWEPATDCGELKFKFHLFGSDSTPDHVADRLQHPPTAVIGRGTKGKWKRVGSLGSIEPSSIQLLTLEQLSAKRMKVRIQNRSNHATSAALTLGEHSIKLGKMGPEQINTLVLGLEKKGKWKVLKS